MPTRLPVLGPSDVHELLLMLSELAQREIPLAQVQDLEFAFGLAGMGRFLVSIYRQRGSLGAMVRRVPTHPPLLADLGLGPEASSRVGVPGLTLVAGPQRQAVIHALVADYNANWRGHVVILESPLYYLHRDVTAAIVQREVGVDVQDMATGVCNAMRQGSDLLVLGQLDAPEAVEATLTAAESGMAVIAGVGAPDADLAFWWLTRMFFGEHREVVEKRLTREHRATLVHPTATPVRVHTLRAL